MPDPPLLFIIFVLVKAGILQMFTMYCTARFKIYNRKVMSKKKKYCTRFKIIYVMFNIVAKKRKIMLPMQYHYST